MREILFRGKSIYTGKWAVSVCPHGVMRSGHLCDDFIPDTVGQFTGLTDKNGKKIFEGDIVRILGDQSSADWRNVDYVALIAFIDGGFCALDGTVEDHGFRRYALARMDFDLEIIGNIHDNPELLEVTADG